MLVYISVKLNYFPLFLAYFIFKVNRKRGAMTA